MGLRFQGPKLEGRLSGGTRDIEEFGIWRFVGGIPLKLGSINNLKSLCLTTMSKRAWMTARL
jgi:hypothetical protein